MGTSSERVHQPVYRRARCVKTRISAQDLCEDAQSMNWDDLHYVLVLARTGALSRAARVLKVDHTTVGRRVEAADQVEQRRLARARRPQERDKFTRRDT